MTDKLTEENLQAERRASEYLPWVERCIELTGSSKEGKRAIRLRQGLAKPLVEEALPIGIFAKYHFGEANDATIRLVLGNQNFDAEVAGADAGLEHIEVTQAHEGENEHLRMLQLEEKGSVSTIGEVRKTGTKATGITIEVESIALSHTEVRGNELARVCEAIERKIGKSYPNLTALVVVFDDYISIQDDDDEAALRDAVSELLPKLEAFSWLAIVGWSKKTFLEFDLSG